LYHYNDTNSRAWHGRQAVNLVVPLVIALVVASRGFRVDEGYIAGWVRSAGVVLTSESRPTVRRYLTWSRRCRTAGGLAGLLGPTFYSQLVRGMPLDDGGASFVLMLVGYLLGALVAEVVVNRPRRGAGAAMLLPRRIQDYLPGYALFLQRGLATISLVMIGVYGLVEPHARHDLMPSVASAAAFGLFGVGIAVIVEALQRMIVARRQPAMSTGDVAIDDAMRSSSLHVLAGVGIAFLINLAGGMVLLSLFAITPDPFAFGLSMLFFLTVFPTSIFFWFDLAKPHGFKVRRGPKEGVTA
jgi:hypothetical protein